VTFVFWTGFVVAQPSAPADVQESLNQAQQAERQGDWDGAVRAYTEAIRLDPTSAEAYALRGQAYVKLAKKWRAVVDLRKALELDAENEQYRRQLEQLQREPVDLRTWRVQGYAANGQWKVAEDGRSVLQEINRSPTFFVSPDTFIDTTVRGSFRVEDTSDDDYIGFVFGYQSPLTEKRDEPYRFEFLLFDWKQGTQGEAKAGFSLVRVKGDYDFEGGGEGGHTVPGFWTREATKEFELLATDLGEEKGWKHNTEHEFQLAYSQDRVRISIDGEQIFDVAGDFPAGRFGFYNYSQAGVRYTGFTRSDIEIPAILTVVSEGNALPPAVTPAVELILDSSESMSEKVSEGDERAKSDVAREVMNELLRELPPEMAVGLRLYGHWGRWVARRTDPKAALVPLTDPRIDTDSELVVPIALLTEGQRKKMVTWLDWAKPRGKTPMVYSLLQAKGDFPAELRGGKTVVLISDGMETCGGKLEDVAAAYRDSGVEAVVHVVGFDIEGTDAQKQLEEIARLGGGRYYGARNAGELSKALREAVPTLGFEVYDQTGEKLVSQGSLNGEPVELSPGTYQVRLSGIKSDPVTVDVATGQDVTLRVNDDGKLAPPQDR
jgi:tetratricopeptide (TPR) repeat protein